MKEEQHGNSAGTSGSHPARFSETVDKLQEKMLLRMIRENGGELVVRTEKDARYGKPPVGWMDSPGLNAAIQRLVERDEIGLKKRERRGLRETVAFLKNTQTTDAGERLDSGDRESASGRER